MDDHAGNTAAERTCTQCGTRADDGLIFCAKCGAALRVPTSLIQSGSQDDNSPPNTMSSMKRTVVTVIRGMAGDSCGGFLALPTEHRCASPRVCPFNCCSPDLPLCAD